MLRPAFVAQAAETLDKIAARTGTTAAVIGFPEARRDLFNAAAVCAKGSVAGVYRKHLLPNYAVFDEARYFAPGDEPGPLFVVGGVRVAVSVCEDAWSPTGPIAAQSAGGAELAVNLAAVTATWRDRLSLHRSAPSEQRWQAELQSMRQALSPAAFETAWREGADWQIDRAISSARESQAVESAATATAA